MRLVLSKFRIFYDSFLQGSGRLGGLDLGICTLASGQRRPAFSRYGYMSSQSKKPKPGSIFYMQAAASALKLPMSTQPTLDHMIIAE
jgi:hypothetical protein